MILLVVGVLLFAAGLWSGLALLIAPLGVVALSASPALWVLFPLLCAAGYVLQVVGVASSRARSLSFALSASLLVLAAAAAIALVATATALIEPVARTFSVWYVLAAAGAIGTIGVAAGTRDAAPGVA